jgi:hypothetical protein
MQQVQHSSTANPLVLGKRGWGRKRIWKIVTRRTFSKEKEQKQENPDEARWARCRPPFAHVP